MAKADDLTLLYLSVTERRSQAPQSRRPRTIQLLQAEKSVLKTSTGKVENWRTSKNNFRYFLRIIKR